MRTNVCLDCHQPFESKRKRSRCDFCSTEHHKKGLREYQRRKRANRVINQFCIQCGADETFYFSSYCREHWISNLVRSSLRPPKDQIESICQTLLSKLEAQKYQCFYTGLTLTPGLNASIEHIKPRSTSPELILDLDNICWVRTEVNRMRSNLPFDEFLRLTELCANSESLRTLAEDQCAPSSSLRTIIAQSENRYPVDFTK